MLDILLNILFINVIVVFLIDLSGGIDHLLKPLLRKTLRIPTNRKIEIPLLECSLCVTFWTSLLYLVIINNINLLTVTLVCLSSFFTSVTKNILLLIRDKLLELTS